MTAFELHVHPFFFFPSSPPSPRRPTVVTEEQGREPTRPCLSARAQTPLSFAILNIFLGKLCAHQQRLCRIIYIFNIPFSLYGPPLRRADNANCRLGIYIYFFYFGRLKMRRCIHRNSFGLISGLSHPTPCSYLS